MKCGELNRPIIAISIERTCNGNLAINFNHADSLDSGYLEWVDMSKYTKSAQGQQCQVRIPGVCNFNPETTVLAHLNGGGMGMKHADIHGAYCCSACHDALDGRTNRHKINMSMGELRLAHLNGVIRTQEIMIKEGILKL